MMKEASESVRTMIWRRAKKSYDGAAECHSDDNTDGGDHNDEDENDDDNITNAHSKFPLWSKLEFHSTHQKWQS